MSAATARTRRGFVMVTMLLSVVALLAFLGLGIDVGYQEFVKTRMQTAADAAALGGAEELKSSGSGNLTASVKADAAANGFTDGKNSVSVTVHSPPSTGYSTADSTAVEVLIQQDVPTFFMTVLGFSTGRVQARAVAHLGSGASCLYALDPRASNAFTASGGATVQFSCGVVVDSSSGNAMSISGGARVTANSIGVVGGFSSSGGAVFTPPPVQGVDLEIDPFANLPKPSVGSCDYTNYNISGGVTVALTPGTYCKGINISGGSRVTLGAGNYILKGGGLNVSGGSIVSGTGVTFYNTYASGNNYGSISFSGGTTITLSAPTTGGLAGILFFQDPTASGPRNSFSGGASMTLNGALYFPTTGVDYSGGTNGDYTIIVAATVGFSGGSTLNNNYSSLPGGSPVKGSATLSE